MRPAGTVHARRWLCDTFRQHSARVRSLGVCCAPSPASLYHTASLAPAAPPAGPVQEQPQGKERGGYNGGLCLTSAAFLCPRRGRRAVLGRHLQPAARHRGGSVAEAVQGAGRACCAHKSAQRPRVTLCSCPLFVPARWASWVCPMWASPRCSTPSPRWASPPRVSIYLYVFYLHLLYMKLSLT